MKKFVALLLAMLMVLANVAALAEDGNDDTTQVTQTSGMDIVLRSPVPGKGTASAPVFIKTYAITGQAEDTEAISFTETLDFDVAVPEGATNPGSEMISVGTNKNNKQVVTIDGTTKNEIPINFPEYKTAGIYKYTIKEKDGSTQGVNYTGKSSTIGVSVYVKWNEDNTALVPTANVYIGSEVEGQKNESIENKYELGSLEVKKEVEGNLADPEKKFTIKVKFEKKENLTVGTDINIVAVAKEGTSVTTASTVTAAELNGNTAPEVTLTLAGNGIDKVTFQNIPYGVSYTISEAAIEGQQEFIENTPAAQTAAVNEAYKYAQDYNTDKTEIKADNKAPKETVKNIKNYQEPETGITLETLPYVLIMAIAVMGVAVLTLRKREEY